jgi:tyrosinase
MSPADRQTVIDGLQRAKSSGAYDDLVRLHQRAMMKNAEGWHRRPILLPSHRWFLTRLEAAMGVELPYWDWVADPELPEGLGGDGDPAQGNRVTTGPFAGWTAIVVNTTSRAVEPRQPPGLIRQTGAKAASLPTAAQVNEVLAQTEYDSPPWHEGSRTGFRNRLEGGAGFRKPAMHNRVHEWVGGDMRTSTAPNDPLFWFHHANVDRIWAGWQTRWGTDRYAGPAGQGPNDPMPGTGGVTPAQMFPIPSYDRLP